MSIKVQGFRGFGACAWLTRREYPSGLLGYSAALSTTLPPSRW
ncbi:hypothetical protein [Azospirillum largimobile]